MTRILCEFNFFSKCDIKITTKVVILEQLEKSFKNSWIQTIMNSDHHKIFIICYLCHYQHQVILQTKQKFLDLDGEIFKKPDVIVGLSPISNHVFLVLLLTFPASFLKICPRVILQTKKYTPPVTHASLS